MTDRDRKGNDLAAREAEEGAGKKLRAWETRRFRSNLLFAASVILIYFFIANLDTMGNKVIGFFSLFSPLLIGVLLALILNIPLRGIEKLFFLLRSKSKAKRKPSDRLISTVSLILTFLLTLLLLYFVGNSVIPQVVESFKSIVGSVESYYPKALSYLEETADRLRGKLYICGHSKGGNLAVYAGVRASYRTRRKIIEIYNHDGPGFYDIQGLGDAYEEMLPKIHSFVPETAVVGMLLERVGEHIVVKSNSKGLMQHDAMSWEVLGPKFVTVKSVSDTSRMVNDILKNWLREISNEERATFVDTLYKILETTQARSLDDLNAEKGRIANVVLKEIGGLDKETKTMLGKTISTLFKEGNQIIKTNIKNKKNKKK